MNFFDSIELFCFIHLSDIKSFPPTSDDRATAKQVVMSSIYQQCEDEILPLIALSLLSFLMCSHKHDLSDL